MPQPMQDLVRYVDGNIAIGIAGTGTSWVFSASAWSYLGLMFGALSGAATFVYMCLKIWEKWGHLNDKTEDL